jgi:hypothetical protein
MDLLFIYIIKAVVYLAVLVSGVLGIFSVYVFVRYGRSKLITTAGSFFFIIFFLSLVTGSLALLNRLS